MLLAVSGQYCNLGVSNQQDMRYLEDVYLLCCLVQAFHCRSSTIIQYQWRLPAIIVCF